MKKHHKKLTAALLAAALALTIGATSASAFTPFAPYFFTTTAFEYPDYAPMGNATVFDIQTYTNEEGNLCDLVFFQPERFYDVLTGNRHNLIGVLDSFVVLDDGGVPQETFDVNGDFASIPQDWSLQGPGTSRYYAVRSIQVSIYDTTTQSFTGHIAIPAVYFKVTL
ncbi:MAG: hypothetical protein LBD95_02200 [Clostridiales Family XIII bacterium]|jgi:hypothetical protein|nr:hypothetical protein [Clostridiales Family XIII bacterium]